MSALLSPNPVLRFYGSDGQPLSGGYLQTLDSETSNPVATYRDAGMTTENPSTIMLDANGEPSDNGVPVGVFLVPDAVYKFKWFDSDMSLVGSSDGIVAGGGSGSGTGLVEVIGTAEHINVTHSVVRGVSVYRVDLAPSLVSKIDSLEESVVQLGDEMDTLEGIVASKADKVSNATAGNLAALDANGNLTDSGKKAADFATDEQGAKADTAVQGVKVNGTELSKDGNNVVDVPVPTASTDTPLKDGTASVGSSTQWARGDHRHPTDDSREAVANKVQSIDDESTTEYPSSKAVADFVNSSVATNTATFLGNFSLADLGLTYPATEVQIASALNSHTWPTGYPTNNDYVYVEIRNPQSTIDDKVQRYKYRDGLASWGYEYTLNNSSFTAEEKAAIDSGITSQDVTNLRADHTTLGTHVADTSNPHQVTAAQAGAEPAFSVLPISKGGTGKTTGKAATNNLFSDINNVNTDPDDTARIVFKYGSPSASNGIFFARAITSLWNYIKGKISSVLGLSENGYTGNAATATTASDYASGGGIDTALQGKSSTSHTHSVKINGTTKTIPATGGTAVDLGTFLTQHQDISGKQDALPKSGTSYAIDISGYAATAGSAGSASRATTAANYTNDGAIASALDGKQNALPTTGTASTTYAINVSGKAETAGTADSANSVAWSNVSSKPTKLSDFTDDITQQNYNATSTNPQSGTAVAQAVAKSYVANAYSGSSAKNFKAIELSLTGSASANRLLGILEVGAGGSSAQCMFDINAVYTASSHTAGTVVSKLCWLANNTNNLKLAYSIDTATDKLTIYVKNLSAWYSAQIRVLTVQTENQNRLGYVTVFDNTSVTLPDSAVEFTEIDSRDASWINSGTFDAARIPTIMPSMVESGSYYPISTTGLNAYISSSSSGYDLIDMVIAKVTKSGSTANSVITLLAVQGDDYGGEENQGIYIIQASYRGHAALTVSKVREGSGFEGIYYYTDDTYMYVVYRRAHYSGCVTVKLLGKPAGAESVVNMTAPSGVTLTEATYRELAVANGSYPSMSVGSASQVSATGTQKAVAVSVDGISHTNGSKYTVIDGGQVATDTLSAETAVNSDGFWAKTFVLVYGGNTPGSPTGNYVLISPNGIQCNGVAAFTGNLVGNSSTASGVKDYSDASKTIEIGYAGQSLTSATYLAAYAVVDGHYYIKDISPSNVTVGRATADGSGNNIVNTYQQKIVYGMSTRSFDNVTVASLENKSIGDRGSGAPGIAWPSFMANVNYLIEVDFTLSFTIPAGGCSVAVYLKHGSSYDNGTVIDTSVIAQYVYASTPVNLSVHLSKGASFSGSSDTRLFLGIFNSAQTAITFSVTNIRIKAIPNYVWMDGL